MFENAGDRANKKVKPKGSPPMIRFNCPACAAVVSCADKYAGRKTACPSCKTTIVVPDAPAPDAFAAVGQSPARQNQSQERPSESDQDEATTPKKGPAPMKRNALLNTMKMAIWAAVFFWCLLPIFWWLFIAVTNAIDAQPNQRPMPMMGPGPNAGFMMQLMSSVFMITMFLYSCWCAAGVVCGFGMERTIVVVASLFEKKAAAED